MSFFSQIELNKANIAWAEDRYDTLNGRVWQHKSEFEEEVKSLRGQIQALKAELQFAVGALSDEDVVAADGYMYKLVDGVLCGWKPGLSLKWEPLDVEQIDRVGRVLETLKGQS